MYARLNLYYNLINRQRELELTLRFQLVIDSRQVLIG